MFPKASYAPEMRKKLSKYKPHDLRALVEAAKRKSGDVDIAFILTLREHNEARAKELLKGLGVDPEQPNAWEIGFFKLAVIHHGVAHLDASACKCFELVASHMLPAKTRVNRTNS